MYHFHLFGCVSSKVLLSYQIAIEFHQKALCWPEAPIAAPRKAAPARGPALDANHVAPRKNSLRGSNLPGDTACPKVCPSLSCCRKCCTGSPRLWHSAFKLAVSWASKSLSSSKKTEHRAVKSKAGARCTLRCPARASQQPSKSRCAVLGCPWLRRPLRTCG